jgi:hypothetical protein
MPLLGIMSLQRWPRCLWTTSELSPASAGLLFQLAGAIALDTVVTTKPRNGHAAKGHCGNLGDEAWLPHAACFCCASG